MKIKNYFFLATILILANTGYSQVGIGTTNPSSKSMLDVSSTSDNGATYKGFMPPRVPDLAARNSINPGLSDAGLIVYVEDTQKLQIWSGASWMNIADLAGNPKSFIQNFNTTPVSPELELPIASLIGGTYTSGDNIGGLPSTAMYVSPDRGYGVNNGTATITLGPVDLSESLAEATFEVRLAAFTTDASGGFISSDKVKISVSTTGTAGPYSEELRVIGWAYGRWGFDEGGEAATAYDGDNTAVEFKSRSSGYFSHLKISGIPNSDNLAIKIEMINDDANEVWVIDDAIIYQN